MCVETVAGHVCFVLDAVTMRVKVTASKEPLYFTLPNETVFVCASCRCFSLH